MKVYLIKVSAPGPFKKYKKATGAPPQNIFSVAAATPSGVIIEMCDETIGMTPKLRTDADIVALFFHTPDAPHAYTLASKFKDKGKTVILGGLHTSFLPDEAQQYADALLIGEAEEIWPQLLEDWSKGALQKRYERLEPVELATVSPYPTDIIAPARYGHIWSVLVSRGCPHKCGYCAVPPFFKGKYRVRPIENIIQEIKAAPTNWFELHADNLTANRQYALDLFKALAPLKINWYGEATIKLADDPELLEAAAQSGCRELLIGIETPSQAALNETGKGFVSPEQIKEKIAKFHDFGIQVSSSMIFGFDTHTKDIFAESEEFCRYIELDEVEGVLLIPFPGTPLFKKLEEEDRILTRDWSQYDGANTVFRPAGMSVDELEAGSSWFWNQVQKNNNIRTTSLTSPWQNRATNTTKSAIAEPSGSAPFFSSATWQKLKWKALLGLGLIGIGLIMDWYWIWGIFFLAWAIGDIRNRRTHLLEEVARDETPVLYWVIISMWLLFSFFAFSTAPVFADQKASSPPATAVKLQKIVDARYGFSIEVPANWNITQDVSDPYSRSLTCEPTIGDGSVTVIGINYKTAIRYDEMVRHMDPELGLAVPLIKNGKPASPNPPIGMADGKTEVTFRQFTGTYQGEQVTSLLGYGTAGQHGYVVLGMFGKHDAPMGKIVRSAIQTFSTSR